MKQSETVRVTVMALLTAMITPVVTGQPVTLTNSDVRVIINGGEAYNGLIPYYGYFGAFDEASGEETTWSVDPLLVFPDKSTLVLSDGLNGGFGSPTDMGDFVRSTAASDDISIVADTVLIGRNVQSTFNFSTTGTLDGITFVFYTENDIFAYVDDTATFNGSIAGGNLALYQYDSVSGGLFVKLTAGSLQNASLALFGSGVWPDWGTELEAGDISSLSTDGSGFVTRGDVGLALAFSLSDTVAVVRVNYEIEPNTFAPDFRITDISVTGDQSILKWESQVGLLYDVEYSDNPGNLQWYADPGHTNLSGQTGYMCITSSVPTVLKRFYRVKSRL